MYETDEGVASSTPTQRLETTQAPPPAPPTRAPSRWRPVLAAGLVAAVVSAGITIPLTQALVDRGSAAPAPSSASSATTGTDAAPAADAPAGAALSVQQVASRILPSVARVDVVGPQGEGAGSAVIFRRDGYLLTNNHVVQDARQIQVQLPDGSTHDAQVVGTDPGSDLAVIKIDADNLPVPEFADQLPAVGASVVAVGSPFGLDSTVTAGVVSAVNRPLDTPTGRSLLDTIQTDAAINPGNSGGPLVDDHARVVGLNTAIFSPSGANDGIGFAIPSASIIPLAQQLIDHGFVERGFLGVSTQDVDPDIAELYGLPSGAIVRDVQPDGAAEAAGIQRGDLITKVNGDAIASSSDLAGHIGTLKPGDRVTLTIVRNGQEREVTATLGSAPRQG